ncbi:DnaJ-domain-containing protein [Lentithecium fluviatile CBS 122367]|uniref:DnaJ-domain-containing protein n=1 Tax=Lentithecium fluviatile CBS 122367 TaxID=1168545 RepID=A0A6G1IS65_9PLEO|nr:DnaJ-domain-containing protein [Lentithecium fluviatile CBS 122367]
MAYFTMNVITMTTSTGFTVAPESRSRSPIGGQGSREPLPSSDVPPAAQNPPKPLKGSRGKGSSSFAVYVDLESSFPAPKKGKPHETATPKKKGRAPLGALGDSGNSTSSPSPQEPDVPFTFNPFDPNWEDKENHVPYTPYTPAAAPVPSRLRQQPQSLTGAESRPIPRKNRRRDNANHHAASGPRGPRSMVLYDELEVKDWKACKKEIKKAVYKLALRVHPDKVSTGKAAATKKMQRILAARSVLLDAAKRRQYDRDGVLPLTWPC